MSARETEQQLISRLKELCSARGHSYKVIKYVNSRESTISFSCYNHEITESHSLKQYQQSRWGLTCCASLGIERLLSNKQLKNRLFTKVELLAEQRNHFISEFQFKNRLNCSFSVYCKTHDAIHPLIHYKNYASSKVKWGVNCCASSKITTQRSLTKREECKTRMATERLVKMEMKKEQRKTILFLKLQMLAKQKNHVISEFQFENRVNCSFSVHCKTHHTTHPLIHYKNYASSRTKWGVNCCAYPVLKKERNDEELKQQIRNRIKKWRRKLCPSKGERWCCELTGLMSQNVINNTGKLNVEAHHLYGGQGYHNVVFIKENGILLLGIFHHEFHKKLRNPLDITPNSFFLFLKRLKRDRAYLLSCLKELSHTLMKNTYFEAKTRCVHPVTGKDAYKIESKLKQVNASLFVPCFLLDNAEAPDLSDMLKQIDLLIAKIGSMQSILEAYKDGKLIIPEDEKNTFLSHPKRIS